MATTTRTVDTMQKIVSRRGKRAFQWYGDRSRTGARGLVFLLAAVRYCCCRYRDLLFSSPSSSCMISGFVSLDTGFNSHVHLHEYEPTSLHNPATILDRLTFPFACDSKEMWGKVSILALPNKSRLDFYVCKRSSSVQETMKVSTNTVYPPLVPRPKHPARIIIPIARETTQTPP